MIRSITLLSAFFILFGAFAQTDSLTRKRNYFNSFFSGTLMGCGECNSGKDFTFSFITQHGVKFKSGIKLSGGTGLDVYDNWRIFPLVAGFTFDKEKRTNGLYFHVNTGYAFGHYLKVSPWETGEEIHKGGFTINPMLGYRIGNEKLRVYVQAGYKYQDASFSIDYTDFGYGYSRDYNLKRFVLQMGFGLR